MKLFELTGVKQYRDLSPADAIAKLDQARAASITKLRYLGNGTNAVALTDGANVFKFWKDDIAYEKFVELCLANDSPYLPKIKSKIKVLRNLLTASHQRIDVKYIKMELLTPFKGTPFIKPVWIDKNIIQKIYGEDGGENDGLWMNSLAFAARRSATGAEAVDKVLERYQDPLINFDPSEHHASVNPMITDLADILVKIAKIMDTTDSFDIRAPNLAMRGKQLVLLDPISNEQDLMLNHDILKLRDID